MLDWLAVVLLGVIEGVTEFLPVSSTGHLLLAQRWLPAQTDLFNIVIQCGAVLAVLPLFRKRIASMLSLSPGGQAYAARVIVAFGITAVGGLALDKFGIGLPDDVLPIAIALVVGGIAFLVAERVVDIRAAGVRNASLSGGEASPSAPHQTHHGDKQQSGLFCEAQSTLAWSVVVAVGAGQLLAAVFPGTSRSGATIVIMLLLGVSRVAATEFTFLVGIPTILAAGGYKIFKALRADGVSGEDWSMVILGSVVAAVVSFVVVKWLLVYVQTHSFRAFGIYRIVVGLIFFAVLALG